MIYWIIIGVLLLIAAGCFTVVYLDDSPRYNSMRKRQKIDQAADKAKREMNEAAGQSWRNIL